MLSTTRNVIAAVLLLAALSLMSPAAGDIHAYSSDGGRRNFDGLSALFGGVPPADGLKAFLVDARLENTCKPMAPPPPGRGGKLIVLMAHSGGCSHAAQVLNAQRAGYGAAIVHAIDSRSGGLTRMGLTWEVSVWMLIHIPSVSVSEETADSLKRNYTDDKGGHVVLMPDAGQNSADIVGEIVTFLGGLGTGIGAVGCFATALAQRSRLSLVASLMSLLGVLSVLGLLFWFPVLFTMWLSVILWYAGLESWLKLSQTRRLKLDERLLTLLMFIIIMAWSVCVPALGWLLLLVSVAFFVSVLYLVIFVLLRTHLALRADARTIKELRKKQIHEYKTDDPYDMCSICLEEYQEGEELRVLPCSHAYHSVCLEPWLSDMMKTTCPLCGQDVANREAETGAAFP